MCLFIPLKRWQLSISYVDKCECFLKVMFRRNSMNQVSRKRITQCYSFTIAHTTKLTYSIHRRIKVTSPTKRFTVPS